MKKHGEAKNGAVTPTYITWISVRGRCTKEGYAHYSRYGGSGIRVCDRWQDYSAFLADMGPRPPGTTLDRIDGKGNYEPGNCRWATPSEQARNRSSNVRLTAFGETKSIVEWAEDPRCRVKRKTLEHRIRAQKLEPEIAIAAPTRKGRSPLVMKDDA